VRKSGISRDLSREENAMSLEEITETEMRFSALEYLVNKLFITIYQATKVDQAKIDASQRELLAKANERTFPKLDPALSDVAAAAFHEALRDLVNGQREMLGMQKI
jgi:hypothetical protein